MFAGLNFRVLNYVISHHNQFWAWSRIGNVAIPNLSFSLLFLSSIFQAIFLKRLSANSFAHFSVLSLFIRTFVSKISPDENRIIKFRYHN